MKGKDTDRKAFTFSEAEKLYVFRVIMILCLFQYAISNLVPLEPAGDPLKAMTNISLFSHLETYLSQKRKICFSTSTVE